MVEDKQLTAVSFLIKALSDKIAFTPESELAIWHAQLYEQALAMEREQIIESFMEGTKMDNINDELSSRFNACIYYGENYGGQDE
jgi:hypothetical protein